ncbi:MAG: hypothetical protein AB1646_15500 [Thermodesulfobacteriota bacterium]
MAVLSRKSPRKTGWTPPAVQYHEEFFPVQSFAWIGKSGGAPTDFPHCGDADYDEVADTRVAGLAMPSHNDDAYLVWRVPQQMLVTDDLGLKLVYTSTGTPEQTVNSASGKVAWKLSFAKIAEASEMSGVIYTTLTNNGTDFQEINYSGNTAYSGQARLMTSTWAQVYGFKDNEPESGTNFSHGDLVVFKITRDSGSVAAHIPVALIGAVVRYQRDRL